MSFRTTIQAEMLKRLYLDEGLTAAVIASRVGCSEITIRRRLRFFEIPVRSRGPRVLDLEAPSTRHVWSRDLAYVVGLMATDGNLSRTRSRLSLSSNDPDLLETVRRCLHLKNAITPYTTERCYHIQWRDRSFHQWLIDIRLTPATSLTIGALAIPDEYFADFLRGCIDGDGSVLRARVATLLGVNGAITEEKKRGYRSIWRLRYAKAESNRVLRWIYYAPNVPSLLRKRAKAERFLSPLGCSRLQPRGRPRAGWLYNEAGRDRAGVE